MRSVWLAIAMAVLVAGCEPPACAEVGPPFAFQVTLAYFGAAPRLHAELETELEEDRIDLPWDGLIRAGGWMTAVTFEWGGDLPGGSMGAFRASADWREPVELMLASEQDGNGCPTTVRGVASLAQLAP